jgi:hypothetical protein
MRAFSIAIDGSTVASVTTEELDVLSVSITGAKIDDDAAHVECSGGSYPDGAESTYLIWLSDVPLRPGQVVRVSVFDQGAKSHPGKTIDELCPNEPVLTDNEWLSKEDVIAKLRLRSHVRDRLSLVLRSSRGPEIRAALKPEEHGFGISILWNWVNPERVSASLHTYSLDQLLTREEFAYHFRDRLEPGDWLEVEIEA